MDEGTQQKKAEDCFDASGARHARARIGQDTICKRTGACDGAVVPSFIGVCCIAPAWQKEPEHTAATADYQRVGYLPKVKSYQIVVAPPGVGLRQKLDTKPAFGKLAGVLAWACGDCEVQAWHV